ncbi:bifunctional serine/threonine-protein kinase/formylglycine-generating enzyme family protein [Thalassoroseus pseudoceratinae]|uniref:bifunctional serine/threonine-protein kinase/formylglycine-generating enzyme family protein n=1 Tax=Thalassoroseus pseudoceratinae TaxID=2713176 RepID=UPI0014243DE1|nr:SUMF1/EgtB/PvdO family nonheme iron enzyme [Thalassoroseus pseudoceratinae]
MSQQERRKRFKDAVVASNLVTSTDLERILETLPDDKRGSSRALADALIAEGLLTKWQCKMIQKGKSRRYFFVAEYKLLEELGRGGMGVVYRAEHTFLRKQVALKKMLPHIVARPGAKDRFVREALVGAALEHPNLVPTHDAGVHGKTVFMVMPFITGSDLQKHIRDHGPMNEADAIGVIRQAAEGLDYIHQKGLVHRDIKPENIKLTEDNCVKILDLGLARIFDETITVTDAVMGTPAFMSPEQLKSTHDVDIRTDIYALGATLFYLLSGRHAFKGPNDSHIYAIIARHHEGRPQNLEEFCPNLSGWVHELVHQMIAINADDRFEDPAALIKFIDSGLMCGDTRPSVKSTETAQVDVEWQSKPQSSAPEFGKSASSDPVSRETTHPIDIDFVFVPAGTFQAGCTVESARQMVAALAISNIEKAVTWLTSQPPITVRTDAFRISRSPITNAQYAEFVNATNAPPPSHWPGTQPHAADRNKPVTQISRLDAEAFCEWAGHRLPTRFEWEKAARGTDGRTYPWGNVFDASRCQCAENQAEGVTEVDQFLDGASPYGLLQACGNVWEWIADESDQPATLRGGSFASTCRVYGATSTPMKSQPSLRHPEFGFRVVAGRQRPAPNPSSESATPIPTPPTSIREANPSSSPVRSQQQTPQARCRELLSQELIRIPAGRFTQGVSAQSIQPLAAQLGLNAVSQAQLVGTGLQTPHVHEYRIARTCVTHEQYQMFLEDTGRPPPANWGTRDAEWLRRPVAGITWNDADAFCRWVGFRLPTVLEWEKAARGIHDDRLYPWGNDFRATICNGAESGRGKTLPVDSLPDGKSPFGLYHAIGNVFEWLAEPNGMMYPLRGGSFQVSCSLYGVIPFAMWANSTHAEPSFGLRIAAD